MADVYIKLVEGSSTFSFLIGRYNNLTLYDVWFKIFLINKNFDDNGYIVEPE